MFTGIAAILAALSINIQAYEPFKIYVFVEATSSYIAVPLPMTFSNREACENAIPAVYEDWIETLNDDIILRNLKTLGLICAVPNAIDT